VPARGLEWALLLTSKTATLRTIPALGIIR